MRPPSADESIGTSGGQPSVGFIRPFRQTDFQSEISQ